ncbi:hypothetical protein [Streptomyces sp. NPDC058664]|uniref:hypothetical protein n=1 Tax=unclassified Streptomyces TaxID=2593676 RepID=UPI003660DF0A
MVLGPAVGVMRPQAADEAPVHPEPPRQLPYSPRLDQFRALVFALDGGPCAYRERRPGFTGPPRSPADRAHAGAPVPYIASGLLAAPGRDTYEVCRSPTDEGPSARPCGRPGRRSGASSPPGGRPRPAGRVRPAGPDGRSGPPRRATARCSTPPARPSGPAPWSYASTTGVP